MYLQRIAIGVVAASLVAGSTGALAAQSSAANKPLGKMTCEDFIALDEQFKPKMIYGRWPTARAASRRAQGSTSKERRR